MDGKGRIRRIVWILVVLLWAVSGPLNGRADAEVRARAIFVGDVMAHKQQLEAAERRLEDGEKVWDFKPQFRRVKPLFERALVVANLETVFAGSERGYAGYPSFNTPDSLTEALNDLGVGVVTLANNHILDRGASGARRTTEVLDGAGIAWTGLGLDDIPANSPLILEHQGLRWAFVSYSYGSNRVLASSDVHLNVISEAAVASGLKRAEMASPDLVVACFHWGVEYQHTPSQHQKRAAETALKHGADLVIGTHPHVLQPVEVRDAESGRARPVVWSLGNFVSFQRTLPRERSGVLAVDVVKHPGMVRARVERLSIAPTRVSVLGSGKSRRIEVVYAGRGGPFNHEGLPSGELRIARNAGDAVLGFLGAAAEPDERGFYTLWSAQEPGALPKPVRKAPR
ncbi:MAG: CapA family protein [Fretibacterium sp.]|nr:CapA family protein [Fretibacterium sp.]